MENSYKYYFVSHELENNKKHKKHSEKQKNNVELILSTKYFMQEKDAKDKHDEIVELECEAQKLIDKANGDAQTECKNNNNNTS